MRRRTICSKSFARCFHPSLPDRKCGHTLRNYLPEIQKECSGIRDNVHMAMTYPRFSLLSISLPPNLHDFTCVYAIVPTHIGMFPIEFNAFFYKNDVAEHITFKIM